jgi:hypothetical protein
MTLTNRGVASSFCDALARGQIAPRGVPEPADVIRGITGTSAATPRSIASTGVARRTVRFDEAGALFEAAGAWFDGVVVTEPILARSVIGHKE